MTPIRIIALAAIAGTGSLLSGCNRSGATTGDGKALAIQNIGSDTMVNIAQTWAETYSEAHPLVSVEVSGGGSGIGMAALINGTCDIANSSRHIEPGELEKVRARYGGEPREMRVGYDALAVYVHPSNPLDEISLDELKDLFREGGPIDRWSQLGVKIPGGRDKIVRVSRQNNSGTYQYFREAVLGKKVDFKLGSLDLNGSKDVVSLISSVREAIGYSGIGYRTAGVKVLKVSRKKGDPGIAPTIETTWDKTYPISRPMFFYLPPKTPPHVADYLAWVVGKEGQAIVEEKGYIPLENR